MDKKGKHVSLRVVFLDEQVHAFQIHVKAYGIVLWEAVTRHLNLLEADYFDLEFLDLNGLQQWLDREKPILKQLPSPDTPLRFLVKFYTPDPALLEDEMTRYLFALQVKRDLSLGSLTCSENTMALLASYIAQAEVGDFPIEEYADHTYLRANNLKYVPKQTEDLERKIMEYHKQHVGETPAEADVNLLDTARKVELYGIRMVPAKDHENVSLNLAVSHSGILVFQGLTKINTFSWAKIRKLSFKRKRLLIKLHPENYGYYKDLVEFFFDSRDECKSFWKKCIEHHGFYRCHRVKKISRHKTRVVSRGSSFRYSGRTQKELAEYVRDSSSTKRPQFERTVSGRISSRSTSVTPKIPAKASLHNSADLHNSTASSGSHILDQSTPSNHLYGNETSEQHADVHSESSVSGSHSLNSPKLERLPSQEGSTPRHEAALSVSEGEDRADIAMVTQQQPVADEQGACNSNFTNILNINTNLDEVEVNEHYLDIVDNSLNLSSVSANQNATDTEEGQSRASCFIESGDTEIDPTTSISLPSELKSFSLDQTDSCSLSSDVKELDQSDLSLHSGLSVEDMADLDQCLQTISNIGCGDLESLVENVVEPLLSVAKTNIAVADTVVPISNMLATEIQMSERAIVEGNVMVGEWVNECQNQVAEKDEFQDVGTAIETSNKQVEDRVIHKTDENGGQLNASVKPSFAEIEPSSCVISTVESGLQNADIIKSKSEPVLKYITGKNETDGTTFDIDDFKDVTGISDMIDDIPYFLHRRLIEGDSERKKETELYTALANALNSATSSLPTQSRRCRSLKRPPNMQIQQLKADEIPFQPRSSSSPSGKREPSKSPSRRSAANKDLASRNKRRSRKCAGSAGHSRSPSGNRRIELVSCHSLPRKDNFSSLDDTASPPNERDMMSPFSKFSRDSSPDVRDQSFEQPSFTSPSPVTESDSEAHGSHMHNISESDSRALSEASISLTQSSMSINESETSQGSYSLSDLNLSRDDVFDNMAEGDMRDGGSRRKVISLEDLDLPYIDSFDESDITETDILHFNTAAPPHHEAFQHLEPKPEHVKLEELSTSVPVMESKIQSAFVEIDLDDVNDRHAGHHSDLPHTNQVSEVEYLDDTSALTYRTLETVLESIGNGVEEVENKYEDISADFENKLETITEHGQNDVKENGICELSSLPSLGSAPKPCLKPLDIPVSQSHHVPPLSQIRQRTVEDDEWESLMKQLKEADDHSPDDLQPSDLLLPLSEVGTRSKISYHKLREPEVSTMEELDQLLLQTTIFDTEGSHAKSFDELDITYTAASFLLSNAAMKEYSTRHDRREFSTFKPSDSPAESHSSASLSSLGDGAGVVTMRLSHDIEDIQMEEKSISEYYCEKQHESRLSTSSPHHAIIRRSISPSRAVEYAGSNMNEAETVDDNEQGITRGIGKRHSYHGETHESMDVQARRKRMEPKRVSFHETVEEITTEAYQTSSSSSDDKSNSDNKDSDLDTPTSATTSDLCYDPDDSSMGESSCQNFQDPRELDREIRHLKPKRTVLSCEVIEGSGGETDDESESTDGEAETDRHEEFLKFAQSLAECGRDFATDSGVGDSMTTTTEVSPSDPLQRLENLNEEYSDDEDDGDDENETDTNTAKGNTPIIQIDKLSAQSFEDLSSSSSSGSDLVPGKKDKRPSIDPLESLEQLHDSYVSSSDESLEGDGTTDVLEND